MCYVMFCDVIIFVWYAMLCYGLSFNKTRIIARSHYSQIPPRKVLCPGVKSTHHGPSSAIIGHHGFLNHSSAYYIILHYYATKIHTPPPINVYSV